MVEVGQSDTICYIVLQAWFIVCTYQEILL